MRRVHVITKKEEIDRARLRDCTVVVIDSLLATSTICMLLEHGAASVIPTETLEEAYEIKAVLGEENCLMAGERKGFEIAGFLRPDPLELIKMELKNKHVILSTTNGTVALRHCSNGKTVYASSLLNYRATSQKLQQYHDDTSLLIVCSGNHGRFSLEDFLTAGAVLAQLSKSPQCSEWELSDSAIAALCLFEKSSEEEIRHLFLTSETGRLLTSLGYEQTLLYLTKNHHYSHVPILQNNTLT